MQITILDPQHQCKCLAAQEIGIQYCKLSCKQKNIFYSWLFIIIHFWKDDIETLNLGRFNILEAEVISKKKELDLDMELTEKA